MARRPRNRAPNQPEQPIPDNDERLRRQLQDVGNNFFSRLFGGQQGGIVPEVRDRSEPVNFDWGIDRARSGSDGSAFVEVDYGDMEARIIANYARQSQNAVEETRRLTEAFNRLQESAGEFTFEAESGRRFTRTGRMTTSQLPEGGPAPTGEELLEHVRRVIQQAREGPQPVTPPTSQGIAVALARVLQSARFDDTTRIVIDRDLQTRSLTIRMDVPEERFAALNGIAFDQLLAEEIARATNGAEVYSEADAVDPWPTREPIEPDPNAEHRNVRGRRLRLRPYEKKDEGKG